MKLYISAGEPSGDMHAAGVVRNIKQRSECDIVGMGGPLMEKAGVRLHETIDRMSTIGFAEVVTSIPRHVKHFSDARSLFRNDPVSAAILVDYPGFHLRLARVASELSVPILYYIAPQLWAWGAGRIRKLRQRVSHIAAILPFEEDYFSRRGVPTTFVGHPLLDRASVPSRAVARKRLGIGDREHVLAMFPGSRSIEIARHWPTFRDTAYTMRRAIPDLRVLVVRSDGVPQDEVGEFQTVSGDSFLAIAAADVVLGKSGTTTLETALVGRPMCIVYKTSMVNFQIARRLVTCDHIGLVNLLLGRRAVPEFVQDEATPHALASALLPLFDSAGSHVQDQLEGMDEAKRLLGTPGAARRVSELALELAA